MTQKVVYYLDSEEAKYVAGELSKSGGIFLDTEFRELQSRRLWRVPIRNLASIFYPDQHYFPEHCALIWGSGKDHDVSLIMSPEVDFMKSVDDAHTDFADEVSTIFTGINECVHNGVLLYNYKTAKAVEVRGNLDTDMRVVECGPKREKKVYVQHRGPSIFSEKAIDYVIHKSIDLDVVPNFPARYDWQNNRGAGFSLEELRIDLERVCETSDVVRFDIGGLHFPTPEERGHYEGKINPRENVLALEFAVECHRVLLETYLQSINKRKRKNIN